MEVTVVTKMKQIAFMAGCPRSQLMKWITNDGFPAGKVGGQWRAVPEDVQQWFREQIEEGMNRGQDRPGRLPVDHPQ